jgi:hypothetical protein
VELPAPTRKYSWGVPHGIHTYQLVHGTLAPMAAVQAYLSSVKLSECIRISSTCIQDFAWGAITIRFCFTLFFRFLLRLRKHSSG